MYAVMLEFVSPVQDRQMLKTHNKVGLVGSDLSAVEDVTRSTGTARH